MPTYDNFSHTSTQCIANRFCVSLVSYKIGAQIWPVFQDWRQVFPANLKPNLWRSNPMAKSYQVKMKPGYNNQECHIYFGLAG